MSEYPKFSVSMCVYGGDNPEYFDTAVASILNQTVKPSEAVITVDGPIPQETEDIIEKYRKISNDVGVLLKTVYLEKNVGHGKARRICFENCSCDLIALMDADDISVCDRFEKQLEIFAKNPEVSVVGGNIKEFIGTPDNCVGRRVVPVADADIKNYMKKRCPMNQVTVMFKKADVASVGGYIDWYCDEDYYLWIRLALAEKTFENTADDLVNVRVGKDMYCRRGGTKYFKSEAKLQIFMKKHKIIGFLRCFINISERFVLQVLMPGKLRAFVFQKMARE